MPVPHKLGVVIHAYNSGTWEIGAEGTEVQGPPQLHFEFRANLRTRDPVSEWEGWGAEAQGALEFVHQTLG